MKRIFSSALFLSVTLFVMSCNSGEATNQAKQISASKDQENSYACSMHPEVTGKEGDKCPKCGMTLVKRNASSNSNAYYMQLATTPAKIIPNKEVVFLLTPQKKDTTNEQVTLETAHEKKIHLILVSHDLSWFDHVHPELTADGSYRVKTAFPAAGHYLAFADYKPVGGDHVVNKIELHVEGAVPPVKQYTGEKLSGASGKYAFSVKPIGGQFVAGNGMQMEGVIEKSGQAVDVNTFTDYLGAKAHIVIIGMDDKEYLHVHPEVVNGKFNIHTTFNKPGIYRGWIQFNGDDKLHTIDFTLNVKQGATLDATKDNPSNSSTTHGEHQAEHHH